MELFFIKYILGGNAEVGTECEVKCVDGFEASWKFPGYNAITCEKGENGPQWDIITKVSFFGKRSL